MRHDQRVPDKVSLRLRFKPAEDLPSTEALWATPVDADDRGGTYRLENSSFMVPLGAGDVVRAELDGEGVLQVTGLVEASPMIMTVVAAPPGADMDLQPVVAVWSKRGAFWTEGRSGMLVTVWSRGVQLDTIAEVLEPVVADGALKWLATAEPEARVAENMPEVDFELDSGEG